MLFCNLMQIITQIFYQFAVFQILDRIGAEVFTDLVQTERKGVFVNEKPTAAPLEIVVVFMQHVYMAYELFLEARGIAVRKYFKIL